MKKLLSLCQSQQNPKHGYPLTPEFSCTWNGQRTLRRWPAKTMDSPRDSNMERLSQAHRLTLRPAPGLGSTHRAVCPGMAGLPHPLPSGHDCLPLRPKVREAATWGAACCCVLCDSHCSCTACHHALLCSYTRALRVRSLGGLSWDSLSCFPNTHPATSLQQEPHKPCTLKARV